jgi:glycosyltransferase involved in cell wall biosynthesis
MNRKNSMVALAHHWLITDRGGERVLREIVRLFPQSTISTLVYKPDLFVDWLLPAQVIVSPLQRIPLSTKYWRFLLSLHPWAFSRLLVPARTKLVISSDASMVKGLSIPDGAAQVCYCHSPPRYLWGMEEVYLRHTSGMGTVGRLVFGVIAGRTRRFDWEAAQRVDHFIANSEFVRERIKRCYGREAVVIHPPVDVEKFSASEPTQDFYLCVSQLVAYKRIDIAVKACTALGRNLVVIGEGSELEKLKEYAGPTVKILGKQSFAQVKWHYERCRAFLHPQIEDFGIAAVEAQAAGRPVIALRAGGALETVSEGQTGIFFDAQNEKALAQKIIEFENMHFSPDECRKNAERFSADKFRDKLWSFLQRHYSTVVTEGLTPLKAASPAGN